MKNLNFVPIILFVYNRYENAKQTVDFLKKNQLASESKLYVFSDGPKNDIDADRVRNVRDFIHTIDGFAEVIIFESESNKGLGASVIGGVSKVLEEHDSVIVVEDDLQTTHDFLKFMNDSLSFYKDDKSIYSIGGYIPPVDLNGRDKSSVVFIPRICSWGWAIWRDRWERNDWGISDYKEFIRDKHQKKCFSRAGIDMLDMLINQVEGFPSAWAIRCDYNRFKQKDSMTVYPCSSKVSNRGADGQGVNTPKTKRYDVMLNEQLETTLKPFSGEDKDITKEYYRFYKRNYKSYFAIYLRRLGVLELVKRLYK